MAGRQAGKQADETPDRFAGEVMPAAPVGRHRNAPDLPGLRTDPTCVKVGAMSAGPFASEKLNRAICRLTLRWLQA
jgi:hypothetical protein